MNQPLVSVIICVYNGEQYLSDAIRSVQDQEYAPIELIVVDDASTDGTATLARSFPDVTLIELDENRGPSNARNIGIAAATGKYIAFLDADDLYLPGKLRKQVAHHKQHPETMYSFTQEELFYEDPEDRPNWTNKAVLQQAHTAYWPSSMMFRREIFDAVGPFEVGNKVMDSTPWVFRAQDLGYYGDVIEEVLLKRRIHASNATHHIKQGQSELFQALKQSIDRRRKRHE